MNRGRPCEYPGCRAWAMRGERLCRAHLTKAHQSADLSGAGPKGRTVLEQRIEEIVGRYAVGSSLERENLSEEIGALRIVLARLLAEEEDPTRLATSIPRIVDAVVRAVRAQRAIGGDTAEGLTSAVTQVLIELGLDGAR